MHTKLSAFILFLLLSALGAAQPKTLRFWAVTGSDLDVRMYRRLASNYEKKTGVHVEVTPLAWGNFLTKYFASMAAGLPPDIGVTNLGGPYDYGSVGGLVDLREAFPNEIQDLERRFNPKLLRMFTIGDKLFGIPSDLSTNVLIYRTDTFDRLGLKAPETWSELNDTIAKIEAAGYRYYFGFPAYAQWAIGLYTMPYGLSGFMRDEAGKPKVTWLDPRYQKGILQAMRLWHMHDSPGKDLGSRTFGMFRSNDPSLHVPLIIDIHSAPSSIDQTAPELKGKWKVAPWPKADDGQAYNIMGGTAYVIFRKSKMQREAFEWMQYLNTEEAQEAMILDRADRGDESGLMISPVSSIWKPANSDFWQHPNLKRMGDLPQVVAEIMPTFGTVETIQGAVEASRLEANLLDQMGTYIRDRLDALGRKHGLTRSELFRRIGDGRLAYEREALERDVAARLRQEYGKIAPQAQTILERETARYQERYGSIIEDMPAYEAKRSLLDVVKAVAFGLLALMGLVVLAIPRYRRHLVSYLFVAPPVALAMIFVFVPAVTALYLSFTDYHPVLPLSTAKWVGTENYGKALTSGDLGSAIKRTMVYALYTLPIGLVIALVFAYLLNAKLKGERFWRFLYFSPLVTSVVSIALIFSQLFLGGKQGWLNSFLLWIGAIRDPIPFLTSEHTFMNAVIVLAIWHGLAFTILVLLAGLQQIPEQLFEAAAIDGAGPTRRFWNVAIPGLRPQLFFVLVLGMIGSFQVFETIYMLAGKSGDAGARFGPNDSALTMVPLIYHTGFETFEMGKSAAMAYVLFAMILALTVVQMRYYRKGNA
ncbi:MAG TPA: extracellular solute-binding protein [Fimbriimonas sp.]